MSQVTAPASPPSPVGVETPANGQPAAPQAPQQDTQPQSPRMPSNPQRLAVARREAAVKAKEAELKALEAKLAERQKSLEPPAPKTFRERFQQDPTKTLQDEGLSYEEITQLVANAPSPEAQRIQQLEAQLAAMNERFQQIDQTFQKRDEDQFQQALQVVSRDVRALVGRSDDYPFIRETQSEDDVVEHIRSHFEQTQELLTVADAAKAIEDQLADNYKRIFASEKIQARLSSTAPAAAPAPGQQTPEIDAKALAKATAQPFQVKAMPPPGQPQVPSTLTQAHTISYSQGSSEEERIQRAILKVQGRLPT